MNSQLEAILRPLGAHIVDGAVRDFGEPAAELAATGANGAGTGGIAADLSHFGVLEFAGADATEFLHNQLSCDVKALASGGISSYGSYCTPKGRMLAVFLLWAEDGSWRMLLPRAILSAIANRLRMFVLRSKVTVTDLSEQLALLGIAGAATTTSIASIGPAPAAPHGVALTSGKASIVALPGQRYLVALAISEAGTAWPALAAQLKPVGPLVWDWTDVRNGVAFVWPQTQEQFIPQMANLDLIGGVSFKKGCYPGQEIVARTQYLGKVKRRLFLAHVDADAQVGNELHSEDVEGQSNGMIAGAAPSPRGGADVLAIVQSASAEASRVHLRTSDGPVLAFEPLPYTVA